MDQSCGEMDEQTDGSILLELKLEVIGQEISGSIPCWLENADD